MDNPFNDAYEPSIGVDFMSKSISFRGQNIKLQMWDTAGQEKYKALTKFFYKDAAVCILVYDITRKETFDNLKNFWYSQLKENSGDKVVLGVAGNKCDMYESEEVTENEARKFAEDIGAIFELTSAQNNTGINELFYEVGNKYLDPNFKPSTDEEKAEKKDEKKIVLNKKDIKKEDKKQKKSFC